MRRTGLVMMILGWLSLAGLIWWVLDGALERRESPNAALVNVTGQSSEVQLMRGSDGHYRAPGIIDGVVVDFLVDTGATEIAIPDGLARRIGLKPGRAFQVRTANGVAIAYATRLGSVTLGGLTAHDVGASIIGNPGSEEVLLGMSFLSRFDISMRDGVMRLQAKP